jgi:hypothetical protein
MRSLILPVLFVMFVATPAAHAQGLEDFESFSRAIGKEISVVDRSGLIREGILEAATADVITLRLGSTTHSFPRAEVAGAEYMKDGRRDGAFKGAILGVITGALTLRDYHRNPEWLSPSANRAGMFLLHVSTYSGLGWLLDATNTNRESLYRAPLASAPALKASWRF